MQLTPPTVIETDDALRERAALVVALNERNREASGIAQRITWLNGVLEGRGVSLDTPVPELALAPVQSIETGE